MFTFEKSLSLCAVKKFFVWVRLRIVCFLGFVLVLGAVLGSV